jgi:N-formylglutamate amidohydrolase
MTSSRARPGPDELSPPFTIGPVDRILRLEPARTGTVPVLVDVPHAGRTYPPQFVAVSRLTSHGLRRSEDAYVDILFRSAPDHGAPLLVAGFPRAFLDVNREPYELDPRMFEGRLPGFANTRSMRVAGGLGTIPRIVGDGQDIYSGRLDIAEGLDRIERYYRPYHQVLRREMAALHRSFGQCVLLDAHSMPSASPEREGGAGCDIVLGDRYGTSAAGWLVDELEEALIAQGLRVARNRPYAGGFITESYGDPKIGLNSVQIEIARALYMDERTLEPHDGFAGLVQAMDSVMARVFPIWTRGLRGQALAAE